MAEPPLLEARDLSVVYRGGHGPIETVHSVSFALSGEKLGLVGNSGSGKSSVARAILGLLRPPARVEAAALKFAGGDLLGLSPRQWSQIRGKDIAMVLQDPRYALNPVLTVGEQVGESLAIHRGIRKKERLEMVVEMLEAVGMPDPARALSAYPYQLSGGMGQRVMLAATLMGNPRLLVADEPTSALDAALRDQVLGLIGSLVERRKMGLLLISHDLSQVSRYCDRVIVMKDGRFVDEGRASELAHSEHLYTRALWACRPSVASFGTLLPTPDGPSQADGLESPVRGGESGERPRAVAAVGDLDVVFQKGHREFRALSSVHLDVWEGETLGIYGPSGCGKTTLLRVLAGIQRSWTGSLRLFGQDMEAGARFRGETRREIQLVFQDPYSSLHPRHTVGRILREILRVSGARAVEDKVLEALDEVGLSPRISESYAHQLSGGQRQRVVIARALLFRPRLLLADEPSSALDSASQAGILNLLSSIKARHGTTLVLVSHDLDVLGHMCERIITMEHGKTRKDYGRREIESGAMLDIA